MPKIKTNKTMKKRFRITKKGKVCGHRTLRRHMMADRTPKKKRQSRRGLQVHHTQVKSLMMRMPYDR